MKYFALLLTVAVMFAACKKDDDDNNNNTEKYTPVVFVHGLLASGDTYANMVMRYTSNGFPADHLFAFDYNSLNFFTSQILDTAGLDDFINEVLMKTGASKVNLVGHSLGGTTGYAYLSDSTHAKKVSFYAHIGSSPQPAAAGPNADVPTMNVYSTDDKVTAGADIPGAKNVMLTGKDHYEVATCEETFDAIYRFFNNDKAPTTLTFVQQTMVKISGKIVSLGENKPKTASTALVYEVNPATGERISSSPAHTLSINAKGEWGPIEVAAGKYFEFYVNPNEANDRQVHYYYESFFHNNPLVYLRTLPPPGSTAGVFLSSIPIDDDQAVVVLFTSNQAVIDTRDSLTVNNIVLSTNDFCSPEDNTIAFFLYDDGDDSTEVTINPVPLFASFPFLEGADIFFPTTTPQSINCRFNGRNMRVRNWKSDTEGVSIAVFN